MMEYQIFIGLGILLGSLLLMAILRPFYTWLFNTDKLDDILTELQEIRQEIARRKAEIPETEKAPDFE